MVFGAAAPLGLLAPGLRKAGAKRLMALTHGHEAGWAALPAARSMLRRIGDSVDTVTYLGEYTRVRLARALSPAAAARMTRLAPGVDISEFYPGAGGAAVRERLGLGSRPVVVCVSRMVPRKGQDTLIRAWPLVLATHAGRHAVPGGGRPVPQPAGADGAPPRGRRLGRLRRRAEPRGAAGLFTTPETCSPCRAGPAGAAWTWKASAWSSWKPPRPGCPWSGGDSGNSPDADPRRGNRVRGAGRQRGGRGGPAEPPAHRPCAAKAMGEKGMAWVHREWHWDVIARRFTEILAGRADRARTPGRRPRGQE